MTSFLAVQVPAVPWLVMPATAQTVSTIAIAVVALVVAAVAVVKAFRERTMLYPLVLLGGVIASFNEPMVDALGGCLHPQVGTWAVFTTFDRPIPLWAVIAYGLFFGAVPLVVRALLSTGPPRVRLLQSVAVIFAANLLIELPILAGQVYVYYGEQPFKAFGLFPLHWLFINGVGVAMIAVVLHRGAHLLAGRRAVAWLIVPAAAQLAAVSVALPAFSLYNSEAAGWLKSLGSIATMIIGGAAILGLSRVLPVQAGGPVREGGAAAHQPVSASSAP